MVFLKTSQKNKIHSKTPVPEVTFLIKLQVQGLAQVFSCEFLKIFRNIFLSEHFRTTAFKKTECSENSQQIYRRIPILKCYLLSNFKVEITLWYGCSVNLLHIFRTPFYKNTYGRLLLKKFHYTCLIWS